LKIRYIDPTYACQASESTALNHALKWAESQGYRQMIAVVGDSANVASVALHIRTGFTEIATLKSHWFQTPWPLA
jgi:phosphinothricin acetyltransferase